MAETWRDTDYSYRKQITIQHASVDSDLSNFPCYVDITADTDLTTAKVQADLDDIRFYDGSGNLLKHEVESYSIDGISCTAHIWVKKPAVYTSPSGADNQVWMYYGNASATNGEDAANVWDSDFEGVWHHPDGSTLDASDSTTNSRDGAITNATAGTGIIGGASSHDGTGDYISISHHADLQAAEFTLSAWIKPTTTHANAYDWMICKSSAYFIAAYNHTWYGGTWGGNLAGDAVSTGSWHYLVLKRSSDGTTYLHRNAVPKNSGSSGSISGTNALEFGRRVGSSNDFTGLCDEVRYSSTYRSDAWTKFEYYNQGGSADNELTWGSEESQSSATQLSPDDATHAHTAGETGFWWLATLGRCRVEAGGLFCTGPRAGQTALAGAGAGTTFTGGGQIGRVVD